ncbi:putative histidine kinase HHK11p, partial [Lophiostoma macrostomum CBS 122681]
SIRSISELKRVSSRKDLAAFTLLDALAFDERPSFVVNSSNEPLQHIPLDMVYCNPALAANDELLAKLKEKDDPSVMFTDIHSGFRSWLYNTSDQQATRGARGTYIYEGHIWSVVKVDQYLVVSGVYNPTPRSEWAGRSGSSSQARQSTIDPREHKEPKNLPQLVQERLPSVPADTPIASTPIREALYCATQFGPYDCTLDTPPPHPSAHIQYFRSVDWESTPLGPMCSWSPQLRCIVNIIMVDTYPGVLFWGEEVAMIYNESYIELISLLHPCMGQSARVAAKDYWQNFQPIIDHINATGEALIEHDLPMFLDRHGFLEETFFSFQFIPILSDSGHIAGYYQPLIETMKNNLLERRVSSLVEIGSQAAKARDLETYWDLVLNAIATNDNDTPFALLYTTATRPGPDMPGFPEPSQYKLRGSIGVEAGHAMAPRTIDYTHGSHIFKPYLVKAAKSRRPTLLHFEEIDMPDSMLDGIHWKGYGDRCRCVIVCPILPTTGEQVLGFLILGVNPRRPFDNEYQQFIHVMNRILATSLASVVLFDEEMRQKEDVIGQAARIEEQLRAELAAKEQKFQRWAARSDVAVFIMDPQGNYIYRNQRWYDIFNVARGINDVMEAWQSIVFAEDIAYCEGLFAKLVVDKAHISFELKTKMAWTPPEALPQSENTQEHYRWVLCSAYPELDANSNITEIVGNVTDISKQKWAEGVQKQRSENAMESKKHLEHFMDTVSHEMRNPLSAIMQCADGILTSYYPAEGELHVPSPTTYSDLLDQTLDAAQTIAQCTQHMKRIVDDILTISKLDSGLLVITPVDTQADSVAFHAVKMFEAEAKAAGVHLEFKVEPSYRDLEVDWVSLDPTRLLQVLINLITNAVKFTRLEARRRVTVTISASLDEPKSDPDGLHFNENKLVSNDRHMEEDWKQGSTLYLQFSVIDTGRGLSDDEQRNLFARFSQASPRTHIHYGGSGLGLFISRRLTELQGGSIGLTSTLNQGSTFSFYIKVRRVKASSVRRGSVPTALPEDIRHRRSSEDNANGTLGSVRPSAVPRRESAAHPTVPPEAIAPPSPPFEQLERTKSNISETLHVLVVEDNLVNQKVLAKQLKNLGCVVSVANHGGEALKFLEKTRHWNHGDAHTQHPTILPDLPLDLHLILMDWEMPIMNGLAATTRIRELERDGRLSARVPVIGITANVRQQQIQTAMEAGMDDVVGKPFRVKELVDRMRGVV